MSEVLVVVGLFVCVIDWWVVDRVFVICIVGGVGIVFVVLYRNLVKNRKLDKLLFILNCRYEFLFFERFVFILRGGIVLLY